MTTRHASLLSSHTTCRGLKVQGGGQADSLPLFPHPHRPSGAPTFFKLPSISVACLAPSHRSTVSPMGKLQGEGEGEASG